MQGTIKIQEASFILRKIEIRSLSMSSAKSEASFASPSITAELSFDEMQNEDRQNRNVKKPHLARWDGPPPRW